MASSQVEIASSSTPFGYALRDHNRRDRWSNRDHHPNSAAFQQNFQDFVHSISGQPPKKSPSGSNSSDQFLHQNNDDGIVDVNPADLWVHIPSYSKNIDGNDDVSENNNHGIVDVNTADLWVHTPSFQKIDGINDVPGKNGVSDKDDVSKNRGKKCDRAREIVLSSMNDENLAHRGSSAPVTPHRREEFSVKVRNSGGVSSLVKKWRCFETEAKSSAPNTPTPAPAKRTHSGPILTDDAESIDHESSVDRRSETMSMHEETSSDWDFDHHRTALSGPPSLRGRDSDASESERLKVSDIIRKLTSTPGNKTEESNNDRESSSSPRLRSSLDQSEQQKAIASCMGSPRLRGRQAFGDLLMQMERDRHRELEGLEEQKAVSKFPQRGRMQAMLRVHFLRRAAVMKDGRQLNCTSSESYRSTQSAIMHLRERFKTESHQVAPEGKISQKEVADSSGVAKAASNQASKDNHHQKVAASTASTCREGTDIVEVDDIENAVEQISLPSPSSSNSSNEASTKSDILQGRTNEGRESAETENSLNDFKEPKQPAEGLQPEETSNNEMIDCADLQRDQQLTETIQDSIHESNHPQGDGEDDTNNQYLSESEHGWVSDVSHTQVGWEELHSDYERQLDGNQDWICDISRPRSEWEDLRQERYQEMLDPFREKDDIRRLLERKSVSSFLTSGLRESIDKLMISRTQKQPSSMESKKEQQLESLAEDEESEYEDGREEELEEEGKVVEAVDGDTGYDVDDEEEKDEDGNQAEKLYNATQEYVDLTASPNSDHAVSSTLQHNTSPNFYSLGSRQCSTVTNQSLIEMELIYELRGHMEQLYQEMSEIKKTIKTCMNMQLKLQRSFKQEVTAALCNSVVSGQRRGRHSAQKRGLSRSMCCICYDVQVDCLLYRCGHMCTCFKCAHELQWSSGSCPVCQAPIVDVVRAHTDS